MARGITDIGLATGQQPATAGGRMAFWGLIAAAVLTVVLWQIPGGNYVLYPFTILATWFHEMAHGLTALLLGGCFTKLLIFSDGSGVAYYSGPLLLGTFGKVLVAAAGPMGPPVAGAALILTSRSLKAASLSLKLLGSFLLISTAVWVRTLFGVVTIPR
jgi:Peptidase M50B-like